MKLAKPHLDLGLFTNRREAQLRFWGETVGLPFDHVAKLGGGVHQLRHHVNGSILKINHAREPLPQDAAPAGWRELLIARDAVTEPRSLTDPDGNAVTLVPPGHLGIRGVGIRMSVRDVDGARAFYLDAMQFDRHGTALRCGDTVLLLHEDPDAALDPPYAAPGYRYATVQVHRCDETHAAILRQGGREGRAPSTIGTTTRYSFVLDPDGNWIEISQRAELTGTLE